MADLPPPPDERSPGASSPSPTTPFAPAGAGGQAVPAPGAFTSHVPPTPAPAADRPVRLQPMSVGEIIDAAVRLYRARWKTLMGIVALVIVPFSLLQAAWIDASMHPVLRNGFVYMEPSAAAAFVPTILSYFLVQPFTEGAVVRVLAGTYLGERVSIGQSFDVAVRKLGWIVLVSIAALLFSLIGAIALLIGTVYVYVKLSFVVMAVVVENQGWGAIARSWDLTKGRWWPIFGATLLAGIIAAIVGFILTIPTIFIIGTDGLQGQGEWVLNGIVTAISSVIVTPFTLAVAVLLYFDSRIRKEAFDLSVMARELGSANA